MSNRAAKIIPLAAHIKPIKLPTYLYAAKNYATKEKQAVSTNKILRFPLLLQQNHQRYLNTASQSHLLYLQKIKNNLALFTTSPSSYRVLELLSPTTDPWLLDHRPVWTTPTLPGMCIIDGMARAVLQQHPNNKITKINNVRFYRWVIIDKPTELHYLVKKNSTTIF
jgi:3-hydroxymyristoyl/3-hydroxydecanoyl-(acyl carrier protein) dehydratase